MRRLMCAGLKFRNIVLSTRIFLENPSRPRLTQIRNWLTGLPVSLNLAVDTLRPASADASFRRYFRLDAGDRTLIVMDARPSTKTAARSCMWAGCCAASA